jgi:hypothetical protein
MKKLCHFCKDEIVNRHGGAKTCLPCMQNPERTGKQKAMSLVSRAIKKGLLAPVSTLICVDCGNSAQVYDHRDYNNPLDVVAVCRKCNHKRGPAIPLDSLELKIV